MAGDEPKGAWQVGDWRVDPTDDTISRDGQTQKLEPRTMRLLICLAESGGGVVSLDQLLSEVWAGVIVGPASVYQAVSQLRRLLGDSGEKPTYIATVARKGYRLVAAARRLMPESAAPVFEPVQLTSVTQPSAVAAGLPAIAFEDVGAAGLPATTAQAVAPAWHARRWPWLVAAGVVTTILAVVLAWTPVRRYFGTTPATPAIVVLPFVDLTADKSDQPFCDGLTEELSNWLAQLPTLRVVARTSAFAFKDRPVDVREIGKQLGTTHVLEGSVRRTGNDLRVTVQLIDAGSGFHVWSGNYDRPVEELVKIQEDIARSVASNLEIRLTQVSTERLAESRRANAQAYQYYLLARYHARQHSKEENDHAVGLYQQAVAADPKFALAYVGWASAIRQDRYYSNRSSDEIEKITAPLLQRAAAIDPDLAEIYLTRGIIFSELQPSQALTELEKAVRLNPNASDAYSGLGYLHLIAAEPRLALEYYDRTLQLDGANYYVHAQRCLALQDLARFDEAAVACARARALRPDASWPYVVSQELEEARGNIAAAFLHSEAAIRLDPTARDMYRWQGFEYLNMNQPELANEVCERASAGTKGSEVDISYASLVLATALATGGPAKLRTSMAALDRGTGTSAQLLFALTRGAMLAGDWTAAAGYLGRALSAPDFNQRLLSDPWQARNGYSNQLVAAAVEMRTGRTASARGRLDDVDRLMSRLIASGVQRYGVYELQAETLAVRGDVGGAVAALEKAEGLGWQDTWLATHEPYFDALRADARYRAILARRQSANAQGRADLARSSSTHR